MFLRKINIFLLSLVMAFAPTLTFSSTYVPPMTAPSMADIAASLGKRGSGGFPPSAGGVALALARIGTGVGVICLAALAVSSDQCGLGSPICSALQTIGITNCKPNSDGTFNKGQQEPPPPPSIYLYYSLCNIAPTHCSIATATYASILANEMVQYKNSQDTLQRVYTLKSMYPATEPYTHVQMSYTGPNNAKGDFNAEIKRVVTPPPPVEEEEPEIADPSDVARAIAASPAAASAVGAAAQAAANASCAGSQGTFNGVSMCIASISASSNPACEGYYGLVNGESVCVPTLGGDSVGGCNGYYGTVNGKSTCIPEIGNNPACSGYLGSFNGKMVCIGGTEANAYDQFVAAQAAVAAAQAAALNPPASRTCANGFTLQPSGICTNNALPLPTTNTCTQGYVFYGNNCVPADPMNPTQPATANPADPTKPISAENPMFPIFCGWATVVCDMVKWLKEEPKAPNNTAITVSNKDIGNTPLENFDINQTRVSFGSSCPAPIPIHFSFMGSSTDLSYSFEPFCDFLTQIRPVIIACAYVGGAYIVSGANRRGDG